MRKHNLAKLALLGISASLAFGCEKTKADEETRSSQQIEQTTDKMKAFRNSLSSSAQEKFDKLTPARQAEAVEMADAKCTGPSSCAGEDKKRINNEAVDKVYDQQKNETTRS